MSAVTYVSLTDDENISVEEQRLNRDLLLLQARLDELEKALREVEDLLQEQGE